MNTSHIIEWNLADVEAISELFPGVHTLTPAVWAQVLYLNCASLSLQAFRTQRIKSS
jgi:hypothetical protein